MNTKIHSNAEGRGNEVMVDSSYLVKCKMLITVPSKEVQNSFILIYYAICMHLPYKKGNELYVDFNGQWNVCSSFNSFQVVAA
jgi:hypothetical protein